MRRRSSWRSLCTFASPTVSAMVEASDPKPDTTTICMGLPLIARSICRNASHSSHWRQVAVFPHDRKFFTVCRSPESPCHRFGWGQRKLSYFLDVRRGFSQLGSSYCASRCTRLRSSWVGRSAIDPFAVARPAVSIGWSPSLRSCSRTRRIAPTPTVSLSPQSMTGSPVAFASSTSSVRSAAGRLPAPRGAQKLTIPAAARVAESFSPSVRQMAVALAGSCGLNLRACQPSPVTPGLRRLSVLRQCFPRCPSLR